MTGPEHFAAAEECLEQATKEDAPEWAAYQVARAQAHATLALAAPQLRSLPAEQEAAQS